MASWLRRMYRYGSLAWKRLTGFLYFGDLGSDLDGNFIDVVHDELYR